MSLRLRLQLALMATVIGSLAFIGCDKATVPTESTEPAANSQESAEQLSQSADTFLAVPDNLESELATAYGNAVERAEQDDPAGFVDLAFASQGVAQAVMENDLELAKELLLQSGESLRKAIDMGAEQLPNENIMNSVILNEAVLRSGQGESELAVSLLASVADSLSLSDLSDLDRFPEWTKARETEGYDEKAATWYAAAAKRELAQDGALFPFEFDATDIAGNSQQLSQLKGKVVIVDLWGTWCPPCRAEIPSFVKLQNEYGDQGFQMIGLNSENGDSDEEKIKLVQDFAQEAGINYPCILADPEMIAQVPNMRGYPTTMFIDKSGSVRHVATGLHSYNYLQALVSTLLSE